MIGYLRGTLLEKHPNQVILDVGGVGYEVNIPVSTFTALPAPGAEARLFVHTHVREDAIALFGFASTDEKALFEKLTGVSGIGPKLAITVLSGLATADLINAIRSGDVARLVRVPGIGKKTAERMILELREKMEGLAMAASLPAPPGPAGALSAIEQDVISALLNLGSPRPAAEAAVRKARAAAPNAPLEFEPLFRRSLELVR
jgi:holliday junction DNA helicase RuvA